jgi:N-acetylneuraminic acid mutarotase
MNFRNATTWLRLLGTLGLLNSAAWGQVKMSERVLPPLPDALGVAGAFAGVSGDALLVAGGANFPGRPPWEGGQKKWHDESYILPRGATNWLTGGQLPRPLGYGVALAYDDGVLCLGGNDAERHHAEVFLLRWRAGRVLVETNFPPLPHPLANACGVLCGGYVYVVGGEAAPGATGALAEAWRLNLAATHAAWQRLPDCPGPGRTLALAATSADRVYILGGVALSAGADGKPARRYLPDIWALGVHDLAWTRHGTLPQPLAAAPGPAPLVGNGWFALIGGDDGSRYGFQPLTQHPGFPSRLTLWHPGQQRFQFGGSLGAPRVTTPAVVWGDELIIPSGEARPGVRSPVVSAYRVEAP